MKSLFGFCVALALAMGAPLSISAIEIESDAILGPKLMSIKHARRQTVLDELAGMIRLWGWRCDTISSARLLVFSTGSKVSCNRYRYTYLIRDRGGRWVVELD